MTYQEKYLKYKKKYLELKGAGFDDLPEELIDEIIVSSQGNCKDLIKAVPVNKQTINAVNWSNLETRIPTINTALNMNNPQSVMCRFAKPTQIDDCNSYRNRCELKYLFNKYLPGQAVPAIFDVNTLNNILLNTVILDNSERNNDIVSLIAFGATEKGIPNEAFISRQLINVIIPNFVTSIGEYAFCRNQLTNVIIPNSVISIGNYAFFGNKLTNVIIPNSVRSIGNYAFNNNKLTNVTIGNSVISIGDFAFFGNKLTNVTIGESVTSIGISAFYNNQLTSVIISNSVKFIGSYAFYGNQLKEVTISNSIKSIGDKAFYDNQLTRVIIPGKFQPTLYKYFNNKDIIFTYT